MNKNILIIYNSLHSIKAEELIKSNFDNNITVFLTDSKLPPYLINDNIRCLTIDNLISENELDEVNLHIKKNFGNKFNIGDKDYTIWNNISLGRSIFKDIREDLLLIIKNLIVVDRLLSINKFELIYLCNGVSLYLKIWEDYASKFKIKVVNYKSKVLNNNDKYQNLIPKKQKYENKKNLIYYKLIFKFNFLISLINYYKNIFKLKIYKYFKIDFILFDVPGHNFQHDLINLSKTYNFKLVKLNFLNEYIKFFLNPKKINYTFNFREFTANSIKSQKFTFKNIDYSKYILNVLEFRFKEFNNLIVYGNFYYKFTERYVPKFLFTSYKISKLTYLLTNICNQKNIQIITVSNQLSNSMMSSITPKFKTDYLLTWAKHHIEFFKSSDPSIKIFPFKFENKYLLTSANKQFTKLQEYGIEKNKINILYVDPRYTETDAIDTPLAYESLTLIEILKTAKLLKDFNFIIKMHPNLSSFNDVHKRVKIIKSFNLNNVKIAPINAKTDVYLRYCKICVHCVSTLGLEFILNDKISINLDLTKKRGSWPIKNQADRAVSIINKDELTNMISELTNDTTKLDKHMKNQKKLIDEMLINDDNKFKDILNKILLKLYENNI